MQPTPVQTPPMLTAEDLQQWIARRERTRARVRRVIAAILGVAVVLIALGWTFFHDQFATMGRLHAAGLTVDWDINLTNFRTGGESFVSYVPHWTSNGRRIDSDILAAIPRLRHVKMLEISNLDISEDELGFIADLPDLVELHINRARQRNFAGPDPVPFTDRVIDHIVGLRHLRSLTLADNRITDAGVARLANLPSLENVDLGNTLVTDRGLMALKALPKLQILNVEETPVTRQGVATFQASMPKVAVSREPEVFNPNLP